METQSIFQIIFPSNTFALQILFVTQLALESNKVSALNAPIIELTLHTEMDSVSVEMDSHGLDSLIQKIRETLSKATDEVTN